VLLIAAGYSWLWDRISGNGHRKTPGSCPLKGVATPKPKPVLFAARLRWILITIWKLVIHLCKFINNNRSASRKTSRVTGEGRKRGKPRLDLKETISRVVKEQQTRGTELGMKIALKVQEIRPGFACIGKTFRKDAPHRSTPSSAFQSVLLAACLLKIRK